MTAGVMGSASGLLRLDARGIVKRFPGVVALRGVDLALEGGEILAVVGENGAGKSTLMKILAGALHADAGTIHLDGRPLRWSSVIEAQRAGVALIHQELSLCEGFDVATNVVLGREQRRGLVLDDAAHRLRAKRALELVGLDVDPEAPVGQLSIAQKQLVEIAKAIDCDARVLIMDEPTSSLSSREIDRLFERIRELSSAGTSIVYISHRLSEIEAVADRALVLRDGRVATLLEGEQLCHDELVHAMVGRRLKSPPQRTSAAKECELLVARALRTELYPDARLDLTIRQGEIVGLAGSVGSGRTALLQTLYGAKRRLGGTMRIGGEPFDPASPREAVRSGLAFAPEDRKADGLLPRDSVLRNISLTRLEHDASGGVLDRVTEEQVVKRAVSDHRIKVRDPSDVVTTLSGGNQQKTVLARALSVTPRLLLLDEPTRGVDIGAKSEIYELIAEQVAEGRAALVASSDNEELLRICDRCLVMAEGRIVASLDRHEMTEERLLKLTTGATGNGSGDVTSSEGAHA